MNLNPHEAIKAQYEADPTLSIECRNTDPKEGSVWWSVTTNPSWIPTFEYRVANGEDRQFNVRGRKS